MLVTNAYGVGALSIMARAPQARAESAISLTLCDAIGSRGGEIHCLLAVFNVVNVRHHLNLSNTLDPTKDLVIGSKDSVA